MILTFEEILTAAREIISEKVQFCFLMGSAATPSFRNDSDIDLAVFWTKSAMDFSSKMQIASELSDRLGREIDLISLNSIDLIFGFQVIDKGRLLLNHNPAQLLKWKVNILSQYPDFKASRLIIEESIKNRKKYV